MRTLVHLSDLHFGRIDRAIVPPLLTTVTQYNPDVVVVSGDLTQRARRREFLAARAFLDALPTPQIVVPGNHDVPLYNLVQRFGQRLEKYRRYITPDLQPFYADDQIAIIGLNTARVLTLKSGRINLKQMAHIQERLGADRAGLVKIVVTHHPFEVPTGHQDRDIVGRARLAIGVLAACGADLLLAGHLHRSYLAHTARRYKVDGYSALVVQAGTATSTRVRGEANAFNVLRLARPHLSIERLTWQPSLGSFAQTAVDRFLHTPTGWIPYSNVPAIDLGESDPPILAP